MTENQITTFTELLESVYEVYGKTISDAATVMFFSALKRYELSDIRRALNAHVVDPVAGKFPPKPADLVLHMDGDPESRSLNAWSKVEQAIGRVGPHQDVVFDDAAVMACIEDMGGWIEICKVSNEEMPYKRNEFAKRYKGYLNRPPQRHPPKFIGLSTASNMQHYPGHQSVPVLIGDPDKAILVLESGKKQSGGAISLADQLKKIPQLVRLNGEEV